MFAPMRLEKYKGVGGQLITRILIADSPIEHGTKIASNEFVPFEIEGVRTVIENKRKDLKPVYVIVS